MNRKKLYSQLSISLATAAILTFAGCNKDDEKNASFDSQSSDAFTTEETIENTFGVVESITESGLEYAASNSGRVAENAELANAEVTFQPDGDAGSLTIDFGDGVAGPDGKTRTGKVMVNYTGNWLSEGTEVTTTLDGFSVDGIKVEGSHVLTNLGMADNVITFQEKITDGKVTWTDNTFATRNVDRTTKWHYGNGLQNLWLEVEGTASGVTANGVAYSSETTAPVIFKASCRVSNTIYFPTEGKKTITLTDQPDMPKIYIDYGSGDCDTSFTVTIGNNSKSFTISDLLI